jgi:hypothetical protein
MLLHLPTKSFWRKRVDSVAVVFGPPVRRTSAAGYDADTGTKDIPEAQETYSMEPRLIRFGARTTFVKEHEPRDAIGKQNRQR